MCAAGTTLIVFCLCKDSKSWIQPAGSFLVEQEPRSIEECGYQKILSDKFYFIQWYTSENLVLRLHVAL